MLTVPVIFYVTTAVKTTVEYKEEKMRLRLLNRNNQTPLCQITILKPYAGNFAKYASGKIPNAPQQKPLK